MRSIMKVYFKKDVTSHSSVSLFYLTENQSDNVEFSSSTSSMKSILKKRDVPNGTQPQVINRRASTPGEEWSLGSSSTRAATPAFPVRRETPLPYHPLLFEGAKDVVSSMQPVNNITCRSPSPHSGYYAQSHRTSISSAESQKQAKQKFEFLRND
ncbi:unnamed protein product [Thelazia callipaeda]|uniref:ZM domain-containing protein n=1 Tax=Thelazia callipaeda TaxID=103827 RepID=A0A0N5CX83_THECL|nr:unnamed protein product [Thelazia callipaeda]